MNHPFIGDLSEKTLEELQTTMSDLTKKQTFMARMGKQDMVNQVAMVINTYQQEYNRRQQDLWDRTFKKQGDKIKIEDGRKT
jgi:hypothetical protein